MPGWHDQDDGPPTALGLLRSRFLAARRSDRGTGARRPSAMDGYGEMHLALVDATRDRSFRHILDIGIGTGTTSRKILVVHPNATIVGVDSSRLNLEAAAACLPPEQVRLVRAGLKDPLPQGPYDLVVSALAIHHLETPAKMSLFGRISDALIPGGRFVLGDVMRDPRRFERVRRSLRGRGNRDEPGVDAGHPLKDQPDLLEDQVAWLASMGFRTTVSWQRDALAVVIADKAVGGVG